MENINKTAFLIAAPKSNSGKTIVSLGLMEALRKRGMQVQAFKCGPDYIDPMHHQQVTGNPSYNLDTWMMDEDHMQEIFNKHACKSDVAIVEGVMGLFDGAVKDKGSSAEIARLLDIPVVLVVDASSVAYSIAPLLYGFKHFDSRLKLAGVIFNKVSGESHYKFLKEAADDVGIESLGFLPKNKDLVLESRHLGLHMPQDQDSNKSVKLAAELLNKHVAIDYLMENCTKKISMFPPQVQIRKSETKTIAVANDEAFNFMYPANLEALTEIGEVLFFSPLRDAELPKADVVWLPGGYPELYAKELSQNTEMMNAIKTFSDNGGRLIAECGGMMYLGKSLFTDDDSELSMCGIFDYKTSSKDTKLTLGYRKLQVNGESYFGHEFHYSILVETSGADDSCKAFSARGREIDMPVFRKQGVWSSYMHLYLGQSEKMESFLKKI